MTISSQSLAFTRPDIVTSLEDIYRAMLVSDKIMEEAANQHRVIFTTQMRSAIGTHSFELDEEPYVQDLIVEHQLILVQRLERLFNNVYFLLPPRKSTDFRMGRSSGLALPTDSASCSIKAFSKIEPITIQVQNEIALLSARTARELMQKFDVRRQQQAKMKQYIWRTMQDDRVRESHAANEGLVFTWGEGNYPGNDPGCRCWPEPIVSEDNGTFLDDQRFQVAALGSMIRLIRQITSKTKGKVDDAAKKPKKPDVKPPKKPDDKPHDEINKKPPRTLDEGKKPPSGGRKDTEWSLGKGKSNEKWRNQMKKRGWDEKQITEAIKNGKEFPAVNKAKPQNLTKRYVHPKTGRSVVRDEVTKEIIQVGGDGFKF